MRNKNKKYVVVFGKNEFEHLWIILWAGVKNLEIQIINRSYVSRLLKILERALIFRKYMKKSVRYLNMYLGDYKGLWFEVSREATDVTIDFYNRIIKYDNGIISYYSRILNTNKFEAYIKKEISMHIFFLLKQLHTIRLSAFLLESHILISETPVNHFVVEYLERKYSVKFKIKWISSSWSMFPLCVYYVWLFTEILKRGIILNKERKEYKLAIEAIWGFKNRTLRSDMIIDNSRFKTKDILMLNWNLPSNHSPETTFEEARKKNFDTALVPELKINITSKFCDILFFYGCVPIKVYFKLLLSSQMYLFNYIFAFHKRCLPVELLMNLYNIKCHISTKDWGDIEETIILNKYGAKNVVFHWSDLTSYKIIYYSFIAHNICYSWGDIHYQHHLHSYFVDERINIGCIYKEKYREAVNDKENITKKLKGFKRERKTVLFCDSSFGSDIVFTEKIFLNFLEIMRNFCKMNSNINILLKPKNIEKDIVVSFTDNLKQYQDVKEELFRFNNFIYLDPLKYSIEEAIAISDLCVTMATSSPSTIALICGKNGLYFDSTGNKNHPFTKKHENIIVFEDEALLFKQIRDILDDKFHCRDAIKENEIREFDAFPDDRALERLKDNLYELTLSN